MRHFLVFSVILLSLYVVILLSKPFRDDNDQNTVGRSVAHTNKIKNSASLMNEGLTLLRVNTHEEIEFKRQDIHAHINGHDPLQLELLPLFLNSWNTSEQKFDEFAIGLKSILKSNSDTGFLAIKAVFLRLPIEKYLAEKYQMLFALSLTEFDGSSAEIRKLAREELLLNPGDDAYFQLVMNVYADHVESQEKAVEDLTLLLSNMQDTKKSQMILGIIENRFPDISANIQLEKPTEEKDEF